MVSLNSEITSQKSDSNALSQGAIFLSQTKTGNKCASLATDTLVAEIFVTFFSQFYPTLSAPQKKSKKIRTMIYTLSNRTMELNCSQQDSSTHRTTTALAKWEGKNVRAYQQDAKRTAEHLRTFYKGDFK